MLTQKGFQQVVCTLYHTCQPITEKQMVHLEVLPSKFQGLSVDWQLALFKTNSMSVTTREGRHDHVTLKELFIHFSCVF